MTPLQTTARRLTLILFCTQSLGSAGFIASATITSLVGAVLSGRASLAGVPAALYLFGTALAAPGWGYVMDRGGRRRALLGGLVLGVGGAGLATLAIVVQGWWLFLSGMILMGGANAALQLSRFVAAEMHPPSQRGLAISNVVLGGTMGAVFGPLLVGPMGRLVRARGVDELAGPYLAALLLFAAAALLIFAALRPDPQEVASAVAAAHPDSHRHGEARRPLRTLLREPAVGVAVVSMVFGQVTMVMLMVITALHMKSHDHALHAISFVISSHTFGMFAFSILSGRLADRWGRGPVIIVGAATLVVACLLAPLSPTVVPIAVALFLLGLGWNFCYVGGSSLLADALSPAERASTQGLNDLLIGLVSAVGSLGSGIIFAGAGYRAMGIVGALAAAMPLLLALWWRRRWGIALPTHG